MASQAGYAAHHFMQRKSEKKTDREFGFAPAAVLAYYRFMQQVSTAETQNASPTTLFRRIPQPSRHC
jgi:hypothetical protein